MSNHGYVYLVGAGPWDPGLLTVRGKALLQRADAVIHDYLVNPELVECVRGDAEVVSVGTPPDRMSQETINSELVRLAREGKVVVRLKGGDPFVFGRGGEEAEALVEAGIEFEVVPGVTAAIASAAYAGIPVTHRAFGSTLGFCTGHFRGDRTDDEVDWSAMAKLSTCVFYMAAGRLGYIANRLIESGRSPETPVALIRWATKPDQRTVVTTLAEAAQDLANAGLQPPISVIVGDVVGLRSRIGWYERKPLFGLRALVTRSRGQQGPLAHRLRELGAEVDSFPTISFTPADQAVFDEAFQVLKKASRVVFTSANAVDYFVDELYERGLDTRAFGGVRIACVGPATARRLRERGLNADDVPAEYVGEALIQLLVGQNVSDEVILIPRAEVARDVLPAALREAGAQVHIAPIYRTLATEVNESLHHDVGSGEVDIITFTSSSTVQNFCSLFRGDELSGIARRVLAACIGPITAQAAEEAGFGNRIVAETYTVAGLVEALELWGRSRSEEVE